MPKNVKFDTLSTVNQLVTFSKKKNDEKREKVTEAIATNLIPAYFPNQQVLINRLITTGGDDLSYLMLTPEQKKQLHALTKATKDAAYYGLSRAFELSFTEKELKALLETQTKLEADSEAYITALVATTADAASKEPLAKNAEKPYADAVVILEQTYPQSYNAACDLIQRMQELLNNTTEAQAKVKGLADNVRALIEAKKKAISRESEKLSEEKNNLDNHKAWTKASYKLYPFVEAAKNPIKLEGWTLDEFSTLLNQGNELIGAADAYLLHEANHHLSKLTGRRHAMKTPVAEQKHFQDKTEKYNTRYTDTQTQLQQKMDSLEGFKLSLDELEAQLQEKLATVSLDTTLKLDHLVLKFKDYTDDAIKLVPYAPMENDQKRDVRILKAEKNEKYSEVTEV